MSAKQQGEMMVFREFAAACPLPLLIGDAENREPPEPDILCPVEAGEKLAFELVEAADVTTDKANPGQEVAVTKYERDSVALRSAIEKAYKHAVAEGTIANPARFEYYYVYVDFKDSATKNQRMKSIPEVIVLLNQLGPGDHSIERKAIRCIRCEPFPGRGPYKGPMFSANTSDFCVGVSIVDRIRDKLRDKDYKTVHPIHLLVWSDTACPKEVVFWQDELLALIESEGMGPFAHLWIFGRADSTVVFDLAC
jgi:hypothetical protein